MSKLHIRRFAFATGTSMALLYLGCVFVMATVSEETAVRFFNSLLHGIDVTTILRRDMPFYEMVIGVLETFVIAWLFGAALAALYNLGASRSERAEKTS